MRKLETEEVKWLAGVQRDPKDQKRYLCRSPQLSSLLSCGSYLWCVPYPQCLAKDHEQVDTQIPVSGLIVFNGAETLASLLPLCLSKKFLFLCKPQNCKYCFHIPFRCLFGPQRSLSCLKGMPRALLLSRSGGERPSEAAKMANCSACCPCS